MAYTPTSAEARAALAYLIEPDRPWPHYVYPSDIDKQGLYELLLALTCPIVCDGHTSNGGAESWHAGCERRAQRAADIIISGSITEYGGPADV